MSNFLDAHDSVTGAALLVWKAEEDSEGISGLESEQICQRCGCLCVRSRLILRLRQAVSELAVP